MFPTRSASDRRWFAPDWMTVSVVLGSVLVLYYIVPLLAMFVAQPWSVVLAKMADPTVIAAATTSLLSASITTVIAAIFGVPLAYWLARTEGRWKPVIHAVVVLPLILPPTVGGLVLLTVIGPNTQIGTAAGTLDIALTRSLIGVILAQTFVASPFTIVTATAAFAGVDRHLEHASRTLGKGRWTTFRRVTLPLAWPGIVAGVTLTFARAMGEFGATLMLAYYPRTMPVQIWVAFIELGVANAYPVAVILVVVAIVALVILNTVGTNPWGG
ncbi:MAG: molybdate ABC transporter permease subunit [Halobacteriales archaeon]